jgi:hypothetical protein
VHGGCRSTSERRAKTCGGDLPAVHGGAGLQVERSQLATPALQLRHTGRQMPHRLGRAARCPGVFGAGEPPQQVGRQPVGAWRRPVQNRISERCRRDGPRRDEPGLARLLGETELVEPRREVARLGGDPGPGPHRRRTGAERDERRHGCPAVVVAAQELASGRGCPPMCVSGRPRRQRVLGPGQQRLGMILLQPVPAELAQRVGQLLVRLSEESGRGECLRAVHRHHRQDARFHHGVLG